MPKLSAKQRAEKHTKCVCEIILIAILIPHKKRAEKLSQRGSQAAAANNKKRVMENEDKFRFLHKISKIFTRTQISFCCEG